MEVFRRIYELDHSSCAQARMGLALRALGHWAEAEAAIAGALQNAADPWVVAARADLTREITDIRTHVGEVEVLLEPTVAGAALWVNGRQVATLPLARPIRVDAGTTVLEVRATGFVTMRRTVEVQGGARAHEEIALVPTGATTVAVGGQPTQSIRNGTQAGGATRSAGIVGLVAAVGFGVAGGLLYWNGEAHYETYVGSAQCRTALAGPETLCPGERGAADMFQGLAIGSFVIGGALLVTGIALLATPARRETRAGESRSALETCHVTLPGGLSCRFTF